MTLNINAQLNTQAEPLTPESEPSRTSDIRSPARVAPIPTSGAEHQRLADELLEELTSLSARDRVGSFKTWHRGSLSLVHLNVVAVLEAEGALPMSRLADLLDVSVASATGIVGRMEQRGYVRREHDTTDRRVVLVHLTAAGTRVFEEITELRRQRLTPLIDELTVEELAGFLRGLRALHAARNRLLTPDEPELAGSPAGGD